MQTLFARNSAALFLALMVGGISAVSLPVYGAEPVVEAPMGDAVAFPLESAPGKIQKWETLLNNAEAELVTNDNAAASEKLTEQALEAAPDEISRATVLNHTGVMRMAKRRFADAQKAFSQSFEIRKKELGETHEKTLQTLSNLGLATYKTGDEKKAEELYKRCIEDKRKGNVPGVSLSSTLTNLGNLYADQHRCGEAKKVYEEALEVDRKILGDEHSEVARDQFNIGVVLFKCNQFAEALPFLQKANDSYTALSDKSGTVKTLHYMALCHHALNDHDKALAMSMKALEMHEGHKGVGHPDTLVHLMNAADSADAAGKTDAAEKMYKQALDAIEAHPNRDNLRLTETNLELAQFYKRHGKIDQSEHYFKRALIHYEHLSKREKRNLYELPLAYSKLLGELKREGESDHLARKYLHVYSAGPAKE